MAEVLNPADEASLMKLNQARFQSRSGAARDTTERRGRVNIVEGPLMVGLAILFDILTSIPYLGVLFNLIAGLTIWFWVKIRGLDRGRPYLSWSGAVAALIETVLNLLFPPAAALVTSFTFAVIFIIIMNTSLVQWATK